MAVVASLDVVLSATVRKFEQGLNRAKTSLKSLAKDLTSTSGIIDRVFSPTGVATLAVASFGAVMRKTINDVSRLADVSSKLNIDPTTLKALEAAADKTGVSTSQLELGLQRMTRRIAEAAKGTGEAQNAIKELGLSAESLVALSPDMAFRRIADAIRNVENPADRIRLAFKLFDSEGVNLVRTLNLGGSEIDKIRSQIVKLNGEIDPNLVSSVKSLEAAWVDLKTAGAATSTSILKDFAPALQTVAALLENLSRTSSFRAFLHLNPLAEAGVRFQNAFSVDPMIGLRGTITAAKIAAGELETTADAVEDTSGEIGGMSEELEKFIKTQRDALKDLEADLHGPLNPMEQMLAHQKEINKFFRFGLIDVEKRNKLLKEAFASTIGEAFQDKMEETERKRKRAEEEIARRREKDRRAELSLISERKRAVEKEIADRIAAIRADSKIGSGAAAIEAGTQAAFQAFNANRSEAIAVDRIAVETKKSRQILEKLEKRAAFLKKAEGI